MLLLEAPVSLLHHCFSLLINDSHLAGIWSGWAGIQIQKGPVDVVDRMDLVDFMDIAADAGQKGFNSCCFYVSKVVLFSPPYGYFIINPVHFQQQYRLEPFSREVFQNRPVLSTKSTKSTKSTMSTKSTPTPVPFPPSTPLNGTATPHRRFF